jgi:hypothetical protein
MSRLYSRMPEKIRNILGHEKPMYFNHKYALDYKKFMGIFLLTNLLRK